MKCARAQNSAQSLNPLSYTAVSKAPCGWIAPGVASGSHSQCARSTELPSGTAMVNPGLLHVLALPNEPWLAIAVSDEVDIVFITFSVQSYIAVERHGIHHDSQTA